MSIATDPHRLAAKLNQSCDCVAANVPALQQRLGATLGAYSANQSLVESHPHLLSAIPFFLSDEHARQMRELIGGIERVVALPVYQEQVLRGAPAIAHHNQGTRGAFLGFDFHVTAEGPKLIEINTNAGGALINLELFREQLQCCSEAKGLSLFRDAAEPGREMIRMFRHEWALARGDQPLRHIAIVDSEPETQYLYPEFVLFKQLFERADIVVSIAPPHDVHFDGRNLICRGEAVDLIYNRLTDFYLEDPTHSHLRQAYLNNQVVLTPHPRSHALYASKRNLVLLSNEDALRQLQVEPELIELLLHGIPRAEPVLPQDAERWWAQRKQWFFKPAGGYASRGVYRGDKLTRRVFAEIMEADYIAQALVAPSERCHRPSSQASLKVDVRNYVYDGRVQLVAARLYQGQTTNFRTPQGGFAPVFFASEDRLASLRG